MYLCPRLLHIVHECCEARLHGGLFLPCTAESRLLLALLPTEAGEGGRLLHLVHTLRQSLL
jgi:hypothetical protein